MYFIPPVNVEVEARDALAQDAAAPNLAVRQAVDPLESLFSEIFGGNPLGDESSTTTTTTRRSSSTLSTRTSSTRATSTSTTSTTTSTRTTAQVVSTPPPSSSTPHSTTTVTSTLPDTANQAANQSDTSSKSGLPSVVIGVIVAASVIFGLIIISLIARKVFQWRRNSRRNTWTRTSIIAPFGAQPTAIKEKALPPPPPSEMAFATSQTQYPSYPAYPPVAMSYANNNNAPYSPAAPSSAGYPAPYSLGGNGTTPMLQNNPNAMFNSSAYTPADLAGPVVIQQTPPTPLTANAAGQQGPISVVKRTFVPSLPDELSITAGDRLRVISAYDDGWALCEKIATGDRGVVPQECLEEAKTTSSNTPAQQLGASDSASRLNRASSLRREQDKSY